MPGISKYLEHAAVGHSWPTDRVISASQAISLKRQADALERIADALENQNRMVLSMHPELINGHGIAVPDRKMEPLAEEWHGVGPGDSATSIEEK